MTKRIPRLSFPSFFSFPALLLAALLWPSTQALALERTGYSMEVLVGGVPLEEYFARGTTYVEALEGREYSIRLTNQTGERVAVALSVDGLNSIDAKTTRAREASKWILGPWESITLDGWQTTSSTARRFFFTTEKESYGAWLGKTKNLGVLSAAVFREKPPQPVPIFHGELRNEPDSGAAGAEKQSAAARAQRADAPAAAPRERLSDDLAATGIGREVGHEVRRISFDEEDSPAAILEARYEYHDALVRLGILPRPGPVWEDPLARRERSHGFEDGDFAPDPYRRGR